jgi:S-adenosylmethionine synthetase
VTEGHPDKICDAISDTILDAMLTEDPHAHVAVETLVTTGQVHVVGEVKTGGYVEIPDLVRKVIRDIGFTSSEVGFDGSTCGVNVAIGAQSQEIDEGVTTSHEYRNGADGQTQDADDEAGAGDQGLMFGYATDETPEYMPLPIATAHRLSRRLTQVRKEGIVDHLRPDGKTQVTFAYDEDGAPHHLDTVVISTQHDPEVTQQWLEEQLREHVINWVVQDADLAKYVTGDLTVLINPSGSFILGGPMGDAGLTGRKIIVDTYGGAAPHGGGAFSGKDSTKVDRSAAYAARYVAKNVVAAGLADRCTLQLAYAIGVARPLSIYIDTHGTGKVSDDKIEKAVAESMDLTPRGIRKYLDLNKPIYARTSAYGHFGRTPDADGGFSWEKTDLADALKRAV